MSADVLGPRALSRATLARQLLLERSRLPVLAAVEHLVGLQAQVPLNPYTALWSRLEAFEPDDLARPLVERKLVRITALRATLHLLTADDCLLLRPLAQPILEQELRRHRDHAPHLRDVDLEPVLEFARTLLAEPRTGPELRAALAERFPQHEAAALAYACRNHLALVQVPPRGVWGRSAQPTLATAEVWLGRPLVADPSPDEVVRRYFAAFGPATVADAATWSRLTGLRTVVERLRPRLRTFRDEHGRELFDVPDAPRPDPDTPAPPRFLPEYDNMLLSYADRSRFVAPDRRARLGAAASIGDGAVLDDGVVCGLWRLERSRDGTATLVVRHAPGLEERATTSITGEAERLLAFLVPETADRAVRLERIAEPTAAAPATGTLLL